MIDLKKICRENKYIIDENNIEAIEQIESYFNSYQKKGLLLYGYYGTGKTWLMNLISQFITEINIVSTETVIRSTQILENVPESFLKECRRFRWKDERSESYIIPRCFDELGGHNDRKLNIYGNQIYPMSVILKTHYEKGIKCHAITNYDLETLTELYGGEVVDRFKEMFVIVKFKGGSRRN